MMKAGTSSPGSAKPRFARAALMCVAAAIACNASGCGHPARQRLADAAAAEARAEARSEMEGRTYEDVVGGCANNCADLNAGFAWAKTHYNDCRSANSTFEKGCWAYSDAIEDCAVAAREAVDLDEKSPGPCPEKQRQAPASPPGN